MNPEYTIQSVTTPPHHPSAVFLFVDSRLVQCWGALVAAACSFLSMLTSVGCIDDVTTIQHRPGDLVMVGDAMYDITIAKLLLPWLRELASEGEIEARNKGKGAGGEVSVLVSFYLLLIK